MKTALHGNMGFTLIEIMVASIIAAFILLAVFGIFYRAMKMRDNATDQIREGRLKARAVNVIRNDLRNAMVSGGILAGTLQGDSNNTDGDAAFPGYLKLTTTTGKDTSTEMYGDVQQVEYYVIKGGSNAAPTGNGGTLVRIITRDLLDSTPTVTHEEQILTGVQSFQVSFYDGSTWQTSWQITGSYAAASASTTASTSSSSLTSSGSSNTMTLPAAIRIDIQQAAPDANTPAPAPVEIVMPWTSAPFISGTNFVIGSGTGNQGTTQ